MAISEDDDDGAGAIAAAWAQQAGAIGVAWVVLGGLLVALLAGRLPHPAAVVVDIAYVVVTFLGVAASMNWGPAPASRALKPWMRALALLVAFGWVPVLLALLVGVVVTIPEEHHACVRALALVLGDATLLILWVGGVETAGAYGMEPMEEMGRLTWAPPSVLLTTIAFLLFAYNFTQCFLGVDRSVVSTLPTNLRVAYWGFVVMWGYTYFRVMSTPGGSLDAAIAAVEQSGVAKTAWTKCTICDKLKPMRAKHCSKCGRCTLRMDHHCPWLRTCIGYHNYKYFVLFIVYTAIALVFKTATFVPFVAKELVAAIPFGTKLLLAFTATVVVLLTGMLVPFSCFHLWLVSRGRTTIEHLVSKDGHFDFNEGVFRNFQAVFGGNLLLWLLPICPPGGDGATFHYTIWKGEEGKGKHITLAASPKTHMRSAMSSLWLEEEKPKTCLDDMQQSCMHAAVAGAEPGDNSYVALLPQSADDSEDSPRPGNREQL